MLEPLKDILPLLRCPLTGNPLADTGDSAGLTETEHGTRYEFSGDHPVLVDFDSSVLDRSTLLATGARSVITRPKRKSVARWLKDMVAPSDRTTVANVATMIKALYEAEQNPRVLIIGGGTIGTGMQPFYDDPNLRVIAFDIYASSNTQFIADGHRIPLATGSVDGVVIQAVLEHVLDPSAVVGEIHRVLKADGIVYAETPFMQPVHEGAYDFTRFSDSGHRHLFRDFDAIQSGALHGPADQLLRSIEYLVRSLARSRRAGQAAKLALFWLKYLDAVVPPAYAVDAASAVYLLGRKSDHTISGQDVVRYYQGAQG
jgi:SAM-dependent methyltransferase